MLGTPESYQLERHPRYKHGTGRTSWLGREEGSGWGSPDPELLCVAHRGSGQKCPLDSEVQRSLATGQATALLLVRDEVAPQCRLSGRPSGQAEWKMHGGEAE